MVAAAQSSIDQVAPLIRNAVQRFRDELKARFGARVVSVQIFGSWARGQPRVGSDVDVLLLLDGYTFADADALSAAETRALLDTGLPLSVQVLSPTDFETLLARETGFARNVARDGIAV